MENMSCPMDEGRLGAAGIKRKLSMNEECGDARSSHSNDDNLEEMSNSYTEKHSSENSESVDVNEHLRQFDVLDEVQGDDSGSENDDDGQKEIDSSDSDVDVQEIDIENLLDEGLPDDLRERKKMHNYEERSKMVLEEKGKNHFEILPEGWLQVTHNSGLPIYMHKASRVCSVSRPYFLGPGSLRKHQIPVSAIPCLSYKRALEEEKRLKECVEENTAKDVANWTNDDRTVAVSIKVENDETDKANGIVEDVTKIKTVSNDNNDKTMDDQQPQPAKKPRIFGAFTNAKIETVKENLQEQSLTIQQINDYCKNLFVFKNIRVMRFTSWSDRRKFTKHKRNIKNLQRPTLPDGTKLITFPIIANDAEKDNRSKKQYIMNPNNKSNVCILHEYVQHALKKQPTYEFKELENAATPYAATVSINNLKYGTGFGTSKKQAKSEAARETLEILIPEMRDKISAEKSTSTNSSTQQYKDLSIFDEIRIEDPRVTEFCNKTTEPTPHAILTTCLQRNFGLGDIKIDYQVNTGRHKLNEFTMTVGKHKKTVICRNKREGKQIASQAILQILHPHIKTWGSLLRLYGNNSVKSFKEKKQEEQEITVLQSKAAINQPNYAILDKLKLEMTKLMERQQAVQPIGKFVAPAEVDLPIASCSNLNNVEL